MHINDHIRYKAMENQGYYELLDDRKYTNPINPKIAIVLWKLCKMCSTLRVLGAFQEALKNPQDWALRPCLQGTLFQHSFLHYNYSYN